MDRSLLKVDFNLQREEGKETRDERRETRDERRETRDERRFHFVYLRQTLSTPFESLHLPLISQHIPLDSYSEAFPALEAQRPVEPKSVLQLPKTKKRQSLNQRFLNLLNNFSVLTLCKCMALGYLEEYLASSKQLGR